MKVKKRVTKGARLYLLLSLLIIFISIFMLKNVVSSTEPIQEMYINQPFSEKEIEKVQVVRIYDIEKVELPNEQKVFYIIEDELGYHMLKSGNAKLDEIAEEASKLSKARPFDNKLFLFTKKNVIVKKFTYENNDIGIGFSDNNKKVYIIEAVKSKYRIKKLDSDDYWLYRN